MKTVPLGERIILSEEISEKLDTYLADFVNLSFTKAAFLITKGGQLLKQTGISKKNKKLLPVISLISGIFSSTQKIAVLIGDTGFKNFFQEGRRYSIYYSLLVEPFVFATIFDENALLGNIQLLVEEFEEKMRDMLMLTVKGETKASFFNLQLRTPEEAFTDLFNSSA